MADTILNVHQRLAAAMGDVDYIQKEKKQGMNYTIVSHDAVTAKVRPVLLKHGIVYYPVRCEHLHNGNRAECSLTVRFVNVDQPTDFFDVPTFGYGIDPQDKGPGKAMSYAVKYALLKALGLETGDDPDNESVDYSPKDSHSGKATSAKQAGDARLLAALRKSMLENSSVDDLKAWWTDADCKTARSKLSDDQYEALKADFAKHGEALGRSPIHGMTDAEASRHPLNA
jgi:hypothetical protein